MNGSAQAIFKDEILFTTVTPELEIEPAGYHGDDGACGGLGFTC
jgi:hypothetical protein